MERLSPALSRPRPPADSAVSLQLAISRCAENPEQVNKQLELNLHSEKQIAWGSAAAVVSEHSNPIPLCNG